jgi:hypothetical protein
LKILKIKKIFFEKIFLLFGEIARGGKKVKKLFTKKNKLFQRKNV